MFFEYNFFGICKGYDENTLDRIVRKLVIWGSRRVIMILKVMGTLKVLDPNDLNSS